MCLSTNTTRRPVRSTTTASQALGLLIAGGIGLLIPMLTVAETAQVERREASSEGAIAMARAGHTDRALAELAELRTAMPDDEKLLHEQTTVLAWAERDRDVLANAAFIDRGTAPLYVLAAIAKSARNLKQYADAGAWYTAILARDSDNLDARLGLAMTRGDSGDPAAGLAIIGSLDAAERRQAATLLSEAYLYELEGRTVEALTAYERVLETQPGHRSALRGKALAYRRLLLPDDALRVEAEHPGVLSGAEIEALGADRIALAVRYGSQTSFPASNRFRGTDAAIVELDRSLATGAYGPAVEHRLRLDRVVALADRLRVDEAISEYEALEADPDGVPVYVLAAAADAYLQRRRPEAALPLLHSAIDRAPDDVRLRLSLFYALSAAEDHRSAMAAADSLVEQVPMAQQTAGSRVSKPNPAYMRAEIAAGLARAYADYLAESQARFESLLATAPHNTDVRHELAGVYRWRGWMDRSLFEYDQVLAVEPGLLAARVGRTHLLLDRREWMLAEDELSRLLADHGEYPAVLRLRDRWALHNASELRIIGSDGRSSGETFGSEQYQLDAFWFTRPLGFRYRAFVHTHDAAAEFSDGNGDGTRQRIGAGAEYRYRNWEWTAELSGSRSGSTQAGLRLSADRRLGDFWSVGGVLDFNSNETPMQGFRLGIESDVAALTARYAAHESAAASFRLTSQHFSDGNVRTAFGADGRRRLYTAPAFKLDATAELFASRNRQSDVAYFSPASDLGLLAGLAGTWRQFRRYDRSITHSLQFRGGTYRQDGFGSRAVWLADYEFRLRLSDGLSLVAGARRSRMVYDGSDEYQTTILGSVEARF